MAEFRLAAEMGVGETRSLYSVKLPDLDYWLRRVPCQMGCPVRTDCGRYVQCIASGEDHDGYLSARAPNPLASICGRVCAAPCEDNCRRKHVDSPVAIRALKRHLCERFGVESKAPSGFLELQHGASEPGNKWRWHLPLLPGELAGAGRGRKVAVIGAGPAGLACAHDLAIMGYSVTIFEASERAGGMAFHGIPEFRLPRQVLDGEVQAILDLGVELRLRSPLSASFGLGELRAQGFEAVFLGVGVQKGRDLSCPGRELDGIVPAIEYLININNGYKVPSAKRVLVVGGGFVAFDAARMALRAMTGEAESGSGMEPALDAARLAARAGAEVTLMSLESFAEMPVTRTEQGREELEQARNEGIQLLPQRSVAAFEGSGRVERVRLIGVKRTYDESGRFAPIFDEGVKDEREADLVILAVGQQADLSFLRPEDGVELTPARTIKVDQTLATSARGVFAGGDVAFGPRNLIDAVADGKRAARGIHCQLNDAPFEERFKLRFEKIATHAYQRRFGYERVRRQAPPVEELDRRSGITEVERDYSSEEARRQADRCLACHIQTIYDPELCVLCNRCVDICPESCLRLVPLDQIDLPADQLRAAAAAGGAEPDAAGASAMIKDDETCIRCGLCAIRCPTDAMTMEVLYYEQG